MSNLFKRLQIVVEPESQVYRDGTNVARLNITVSRFGKEDVHIQRLVPDNDFESYWDYVWNVCKNLLDEELKRTDKGKEL